MVNLTARGVKARSCGVPVWAMLKFSGGGGVANHDAKCNLKQIGQSVLDLFAHYVMRRGWINLHNCIVMQSTTREVITVSPSQFPTPPTSGPRSGGCMVII